MGFEGCILCDLCGPNSKWRLKLEGGTSHGFNKATNTEKDRYFWWGYLELRNSGGGQLYCGSDISRLLRKTLRVKNNFYTPLNHWFIYFLIYRFRNPSLWSTLRFIPPGMHCDMFLMILLMRIRVCLKNGTVWTESDVFIHESAFLVMSQRAILQSLMFHEPDYRRMCDYAKHALWQYKADPASNIDELCTKFHYFW